MCLACHGEKGGDTRLSGAGVQRMGLAADGTVLVDRGPRVCVEEGLEGDVGYNRYARVDIERSKVECDE